MWWFVIGSFHLTDSCTMVLFFSSLECSFLYLWNGKFLKCRKMIQKVLSSPAAAAKLLQSCPTLCDPIDSSPPGSPVLRFSRQEHWSRSPFPSPMHERKSESEVAQSCLTLCNPMDCSPPGSSVHGVFQARVLEWGAISFSRGSSWSRDWTQVSYVSCTGRWILYQLSHWCYIALS